MDSVRRISAAFELLPVFCGNHGKNQSDQNLSLQSGSIFGNQAFYYLSEEAGNDSSSSKSARKCRGKVSGSVSSKTDYLISNEPSTSAKSVKAAKLGVPVITEEEFLEKFKTQEETL